MRKELYVEILEETLVSFITDVFPSTHKFMQDNDPKHVSNYAKDWMSTNSITWWKIPPISIQLRRTVLRLEPFRKNTMRTVLRFSWYGLTVRTSSF